MSRHGRATGESLALHGLLILAMTAFAQAVKPPAKVTRLDLAMLEQFVAPAPGAAPEKKVTAVPPTPQQPEVVQKKKPPAPAKPVKASKPKALPTTTLPPPGPVENVTASAPPPETESAVAETSTRQSVAGPVAAVAEPVAAEPAVSAGELYRSANFTAIRSAILAKLYYPTLARRKGWAGKVEIAFKIFPDGGIDDLRVLTSSGYPVLDEQAAEAVRQAAPFTPPPETALLVMPVTFQLD